MANNVTKAANTGVSTDMLNRLSSGIQQSRASTPLAGGKPFLRMLKDGNWVFGQSDDAVQEGSEWVVNTLSIMHGYSCWSNYPPALKKKNVLLGETMASIFDPKPPKPGPIEGFEYNEQRSFDLKCVYGDDDGVEVHYKISSLGGMRAVDKLLGEIDAQIKAGGAPHVFPVLELLQDSYQHPQWGKTYVPIFNRVNWADTDGNLVEETPAAPEEEAPAPAPAKAPAKRRAAAPVAATPEEAQTVAETPPAATIAAPPAGAPRRQRPAARA